MKFLWDSANVNHIARHNISPEEAEQVVRNTPLDLERQLRGGEERILHLGETDAGRVLFVILTERNHALRIVTAHPAKKRARMFYALQKGEAHDKDPGDP